jgi:hypothetical protein
MIEGVTLCHTSGLRKKSYRRFDAGPSILASPLQSIEGPPHCMEVHPPEHPIFTWKQFFIHMATVCLGLLIALGLEQSVEAIHHRHQRHQLEEDLRAESVYNLRIATTNMQYLDWLARAGIAQVLELHRAEAERRLPVYLTPPARPVPVFIRPSSAVWAVAQTSGALNLIPREEAERYSHVYLAMEMLYQQIDRINQATNERTTALIPASSDPLAIGMPGGMDTGYDLDRLNDEERSRFRLATSHTIEFARYFEGQDINLYGLLWGTLHGDSDQQNSRTIVEVRTAFAQGGIAAVLAKYPIP